MSPSGASIGSGGSVGGGNNNNSNNGGGRAMSPSGSSVLSGGSRRGGGGGGGGGSPMELAEDGFVEMFTQEPSNLIAGRQPMISSDMQRLRDTRSLLAVSPLARPVGRRGGRRARGGGARA